LGKLSVIETAIWMEIRLLQQLQDYKVLQAEVKLITCKPHLCTVLDTKNGKQLFALKDQLG